MYIISSHLSLTVFMWSIHRATTFTLFLLVTTAAAQAQSVSWTNTSGGTWSDASNWIDDLGVPRVPGPGDQVSITERAPSGSSYEIVLDQNATIQTLTLDAIDVTLRLDHDLTINGAASLLHRESEISGSGDLTVGGLLTWQGGRITGAGTILTAGGFHLTGQSVSNAYAKLIEGRTLVLPAGATGIYETRNFTGSNGAMLVIEEGADVTLIPSTVHQAFQIASGSEARPTIVNHGLLRKPGGRPELDVLWDIENSGRIEVTEGTLSLQGALPVATGTFTAGAGAVIAFEENGPVVFTESSTLTGEGTVHFLYGADYEIRGTIDIEGTLRLSSTGSSRHAEVTIVPTADMVNLGRWLRLGREEINDSGGRLFYEHSRPIVVDTLTLRNNGGIITDVPITVNEYFAMGERSAVLETTADINILGIARWIGGTFRGSGDVTFHQGVTIEGGRGSASWSKSLEDRRIIIPSGESMEFLGTRTLNGSGTAEILIEEGSEMDFTTSSSLLGSGTVINRGVISKSGGNSLTRISWAVENHGSILAHNDILSLQGTIVDQGGRYEVVEGAELQFDETGPIVFGESSVIAGAGTVHFLRSKEIEVRGTYDIAGSTRLTSSSTSRRAEVDIAATADVLNLGRWLRLGGGSGRNAGAFESGGILRLHRPGAYVVDTLTIGSGHGGFSGPVDMTVNDWFLLGNNNSFYDTEGELHVRGEALWHGGTFRGDGDLRFDGDMTILGGRGSGSWNKALDGRPMIIGNNSTLAYSGTRAVTGMNGAKLIIEEGSTLDVLIMNETPTNPTLTMSVGSGSTEPPRLVNRGLIYSSGQDNMILRSDWEFVNEGTLLVGPLTPEPRGGLLNTASIIGDGTILGGITNTGFIRPGPIVGGTGIIEIEGLLTQSETGSLDIDIGGISAGTSYDQVRASEVELDGILQISLTDGYTLSADDVYQVLLFEEGMHEGSFTEINTLPEGSEVAVRITETAVQVLADGLTDPPSRPAVSVSVDTPSFQRAARAVPVHVNLTTSGGPGIVRMRAKNFDIGLASTPECPMDDAYENLRCRMERFGVTPPEAEPESEEQYPFLHLVPFPGAIQSGGDGGNGQPGSSEIDFTAAFSEGGSLEIDGREVCVVGEEVKPEVEAGRAVMDEDLWGCAYEVGKLALDLVPGYECFKLGAGIATHVGEGFHAGQFDLTGYLAANMVGALNCAGDAVPATKAIRVMMKLNELTSAAGGIQSVAGACSNAAGEQPATSQASSTTRCIASADPNDKVGPPGAGDGRWVTLDDTLSYVVFFENKPEATAAAQVVIIKDTIDVATVDFETFSFGMIAWADTSISMPQNEFSVTRDVDLRPAHDLVLRIDAEIEQATGIITWRFDSLDPETLEPTGDPLAGFLPPNKDFPEGEGLVSYMFAPVAHLESGTRFGHAARIIFDENDPIDTPVWSNGIDIVPPTSRVAELDAVQSTAEFVVRWSGEDAESGVASYDIFVSENSGPFARWMEATSDTSSVYEGVDGSTYAFYSVARDAVGHVEVKEAVEEASTRIDLTATSTEVAGLPQDYALDAPYPNPASSQVTLRYALPRSEHVRVGLYDMLGRKVSTLVDDVQVAGWYPMRITTRHLAAGTYVVRMEAADFRSVKTIVVVR